jgi:anti-sigma factor (TIGR02949 family)
MNPMPCQWLDDYLDNDLTGADLARFEAHLENCSACMRAVGEHRRLTELLSEAVAKEPLPVGLSDRIARKLRATRRRRIAAVALAVAATVAIAFIWWFGQAPIKPKEAILAKHEIKAQPVAPLPAGPDNSPQVEVIFHGNPGVIAVPEKTDSPNITFFWVYPSFANEASSSPTERNDQ